MIIIYNYSHYPQTEVVFCEYLKNTHTVKVNVGRSATKLFLAFLSLPKFH